MNIKRTVFALGAMILGVGFFGASPAFAACTLPPVFHPTTQQPASDYDNWPQNGHMRYCGTGANQNVIKNAANDATASGASTPTPQPRIRWLFSGEGGTAGKPTVEVYAWNSLSDLNSFFGTSFANPPNGVIRGVTLHAGQSVAHPEISVNIIASGNNTTDTRTTNHEIGHALDEMLGDPSAQNTPGSKSNFNLNLDDDIASFNAIQNFNWTNYGGTGGCTGSNFAIVQCKWPADAGNSRELFATAYGVVSGGVINTDIQSLWSSYFTHSKDYMADLKKGLTAP